MVSRIFWRETKRGLRLVERTKHYENTLGAVETGFADSSKIEVGISSGLQEWTRIGEVQSMEEGKALLLKVMEEGVEIRNRWFDSRDANSKRTRFVESAFARIRSNRGGGEATVFQLDKVVGLPGKKAR